VEEVSGGVGPALAASACALAADVGGQVVVLMVDRGGRLVQVHTFEDPELLELALASALAGARGRSYQQRGAVE
jgi:hypothetical protein